MRAIRVRVRLARAGSREAEEFTWQPSHQCSVLHSSEPQKHVVMELKSSPVSKIIPSGNPEKLSQVLQRRLHHYPLYLAHTRPWSSSVHSPSPAAGRCCPSRLMRLCISDPIIIDRLTCEDSDTIEHSRGTLVRCQGWRHPMHT